ERVAAIGGEEMAVADDALGKIPDIALLLRQPGAPGGFHPGLVPAVDRPLRRLAAVVVLQRLALQTKARIARQISGGLFAWHVISPIRRPGMSLASVGGGRSGYSELQGAAWRRGSFARRPLSERRKFGLDS